MSALIASHTHEERTDRTMSKCFGTDCICWVVKYNTIFRMVILGIIGCLDTFLFWVVCRDQVMGVILDIVIFTRLTSPRANSKDFSLELAVFTPKSILITYCHLIFQIHTMLVDYNARIMF